MVSGNVKFIIGVLVAFVAVWFGQLLEQRHLQATLWLGLENEFIQNYERIRSIEIHAARDKGKIENWGSMDGTPMNIPFPNLTFDIWKASKISYVDLFGSTGQEESLLIQNYYYKLEIIDLYVTDRQKAVYALLPYVKAQQIKEQLYIKDKNILLLIEDASSSIDKVGVYYFGEKNWQNKKQIIDKSINSETSSDENHKKNVSAARKMERTLKMDTVTLRYFYSAVMQSMAALLALGGIFAIYRLEYITKKLRLTYEAFKSFIQHYFIDPNTRIYNAQPVFVNGDTHMWLDKDVYHHILTIFEGEFRFFRQNAVANLQRNNNTQGFNLLNALADYFDEIYKLLQFSTRIRILLLIQTIILGTAFLLSSINLINLDENYFLVVLFSIVSIVVSVLYIIFSLFGLRTILLNGPIVNAIDPDRTHNIDQITNKIFECLERERRIYRQAGFRRLLVRYLNIGG